VDSMDRIDDRSVYAIYPYARNGDEMTDHIISHRPTSLPTPPMGNGSGSSMFGNYGINAHSTSYEGLGQGPARALHSTQSVPSPGIYPAFGAEIYDLGGYRQQRYDSVISIAPDTTRSQMPPVTSNSARRPSNFEQASSMDSGLSGVTSSSLDSKLTNASGYTPQGSYSGLRGKNNNSHNSTHPRSLPTPTHQPTYDRAPAQSYSALDSSNTKENMWPIGNASAGHGHYMASHQQWASAGTS